MLYVFRNAERVISIELRHVMSWDTSQCEQRHAAMVAWDYPQEEAGNIWHVVWRFGITMQQGTADTVPCCSSFAGKFWNIHLAVLNLFHRTFVYLGLWSNPWGVTDSTILRKSEWLFVSGFESRRSISSATESLNSYKDKADSLSVLRNCGFK